MELYDDYETAENAESEISAYRAFLIDRGGDPVLIAALGLAVECIRRERARLAGETQDGPAVENKPETMKGRRRYPEALQVGGLSVSVQYWDEFRKPLLVVMEKNEFTKVANFTNDETALWFVDKMHRALQKAGVPFVDDETEGKQE